MGSMVHLAVGNIDIDWGKNRGYTDHGVLFQHGDETTVPYHYVGEDRQPIVKEKQCFCRSLRRVKPRLEMLGYLHLTRTHHRPFYTFSESVSIEPAGNPFRRERRRRPYEFHRHSVGLVLSAGGVHCATERQALHRRASQVIAESRRDGCGIEIALPFHLV